MGMSARTVAKVSGTRPPTDVGGIGEMVDMIVGYVYSYASDPKEREMRLATLKALVLVSMMWRDATRPFLFRRKTVGCPKDLSHLIRFLNHENGKYREGGRERAGLQWQSEKLGSGKLG